MLCARVNVLQLGGGLNSNVWNNKQQITDTYLEYIKSTY